MFYILLSTYHPSPSASGYACVLLDAIFFQLPPSSLFLHFSAWTNVESDLYRQAEENGAGLLAMVS